MYFQNFSSPQTEMLNSLSNNSQFPQPTSPWWLLLSISMNLPILGISYKWNHIILFFSVWLISLSIMFSRFIHIVACVRMSSLLWLNNIPLNVYIYPCILCSHSSVNVWLLRIMPLWIYLYKYLFECLFSVFQEVYLGVELLGNIVILCLPFLGTTKLFSTYRPC